MKVEYFIEKIKQAGIKTLVGVPDTALKPFCDYINCDKCTGFEHYVPANEGAAVGIAIGSYLATSKPACVYMQNSGLGNIVNPITSLANEEVYSIPMLLVIGWRGEPGKKDEPQHRFMGKITEPLLELLHIEYAVLTSETGTQELDNVFQRAEKALRSNKQFGLIVKKDAFETATMHKYKNSYMLPREDAIKTIVNIVSLQDVVVSTTGKISREVYEQSEQIKGHHGQCFLRVGGMGHAGMIALGIAKERSDKRVYCIEGDGAIFMHMGGLAFIGKLNPPNLIHICLNNDAHESVGGMSTGASGTEFHRIAAECGYSYTACVDTIEGLEKELAYIINTQKLAFLEVKVRMESRADLGRPKESALENKISFMRYHAKVSNTGIKQEKRDGYNL